MKAFLMYKDRDFDLKQKLPWNERILIQDLELNTLFKAMAIDDDFLFDVAKKTVLTGVNNDMDTILYRQNILRDCLKNSTIVRDIYDVAIEALEREKKTLWGIFARSPSLYSSIELLQIFVDILKKLKNIADIHACKFESEGFTTFFLMLKKELGDEYFATVRDHLVALKFRNGVLISAELGKGNKGVNYILRKSQENKKSWMERIFSQKPQAYTFYISERDERGARAMSELQDRGIKPVAIALARSAEHILNFFIMLRTELAFYIGCLNLYRQLVQIECAISFPVPVGFKERRHVFKGLYDVCLALTMKQNVVSNDVNADDKNIVIITGANRGGKSVFLRSIGLAQLMMQCGMFVAAGSFCANICNGLFTHYKREEDTDMKSGKLDEELGRMSNIIDNIKPDSMVLFNESFAATNEIEGSEIARQIIYGLVDKGIKVFFVTHLYEFARSFYEKKMKTTIFLQAEREADGRRTFKLIEGEPLQTSYGEDLYKKIFGNV